MNEYFKRGEVEGSTIVIILLSVALIGAGAFGIWGYMSYSEVRSNVDGKIELAVEKAKKDQSEIDEKKYNEELKKPFATFKAPSEFGGISFQYPRTWSAHVADHGLNGQDYLAFLNPGLVPPFTSGAQRQERFALRMAIYHKTMPDVLDKPFEKEIKKAELKTSQVTIAGRNAIKLEGLFPNPNNKDDRIRGIAYYFNVNDKVLMLRTDAETFGDDFDKIVKSLEFSNAS